MNRRTLLTNGLKAAGAVALAASVRPFASARSSVADWTQVAKAEHVATIHRMIEQQGSWWMDVRDRENGKNPVIVYFDNSSPVFEISRNSQQRWQVRYRAITDQEAQEIAEFHANRRWPNNPVGLNVGDRTFTDSDYYVRAFIKNGRKPEWNWSVEKRQ